MILLKLQGDKAVGVYNDIDPNYKPQDNEVVVESLPHVSLENNQIAYIYYRNGKIEYEIKEN